jgi:low temperature requirement protein LtrA
MVGRDPEEAGRTASTLELIFDLAFVIGFGTAANELAHFLAAEHVVTGLLGFSFASFAVAWAWINYTWFASAYDTDDWVYRLLTMVQMVGVLILALGLPQMFDSLEHSDYLNNSVMVLGYVVMRVPMVFQWLRAARQDPARRQACLAYVVTIVVSQVGWVVLLVAQTSVTVTFVCAGFLVLVELAGPLIAETRFGATPWHPHHVAERYGLMVIIALGEGLIGTMALLTVIVGPQGAGWSVDFALIGLSGVALTFGMWWVYFVVPSGEMLQRHRERSFGWGYGHIPLFAAVVGVGAGLHVAAYHLEDHSELGVPGTVLSVAVPLAGFVVMVFVLYSVLTRSTDRFHLWLLLGTAVLVAGPVAMATAGVSLAWCLVVLALSPWVTVVGFELRGHEHLEAVLAEPVED